MNSYEIIKYISNATKKTPCKIFVSGNLTMMKTKNMDFFGNTKWGILFCELSEWKNFHKNNSKHINQFRIEMDRHNSAIPLADYSKYDARIEPGVTIRDLVEIGNNCVIMMGAILNIGVSIGSNTMIDMNVVLGGRAIVGDNCHIGAGAVLAGVIEPPSARSVVIENNVFIGANAVILEGINVGQNSVVAAGAVVVNDVPPNTIVAGVPAIKIKMVESKIKNKICIVKELRKL